MFYSNFLLPFIATFFVKVEIPGIHFMIFVKSAHTCTFHAEKSAYFMIWNILFILWRWENLVFTLIPGNLQPLASKKPCEGFWSKPHYVNLSTWQKKQSWDTNDRKSRQGMRLRNNTFMFFFLGVTQRCVTAQKNEVFH